MLNSHFSFPNPNLCKFRATAGYDKMTKMKNNGRASSNCTLPTLYVQFVCRRSTVQIIIIIIVVMIVIVVLLFSSCPVCVGGCSAVQKQQRVSDFLLHLCLMMIMMTMVVMVTTIVVVVTVMGTGHVMSQWYFKMRRNIDVQISGHKNA